MWGLVIPRDSQLTAMRYGIISWLTRLDRCPQSINTFCWLKAAGGSEKWDCVCVCVFYAKRDFHKTVWQWGPSWWIVLSCLRGPLQALDTSRLVTLSFSLCSSSRIIDNQLCQILVFALSVCSGPGCVCLDWRKSGGKSRQRQTFDVTFPRVRYLGTRAACAHRDLWLRTLEVFVCENY